MRSNHNNMQEWLSVLSILSPTELAYIAGIVDGEGSVGLYELTAQRKYSGIICRVTVSNTDRSLFHWLLEKLPKARVYWPRALAKRRPCGRLVYDGAKGAALCKLMLPYLTIKKRKAEIVVEMYEHSMNYQGFGGVPEEEKRRRKGLLEQLEYELLKGRNAPCAEWPSHQRVQ